MSPFTITRKQTRQIIIGNVKVGGTASITVQSMTNTPTGNVGATVAQILRLQEAGCEIVRVAVPDNEAASAIPLIKEKISIPLIADIHFDYRLALSSARKGADGLRINPGNIGSSKKLKAIIECANEFNIPIRIGVNAGSLEKDILKKYNGATAEAMVESAIRNIELFQSLNFTNIKLSIKASDVPRTIDAYRLLSSKTDFPLHVGVTEAGSLFPGIVKSSLGIGMLLASGIGDTIRVSLTRDPAEEVRVGFEILKALGIRRHGPEIISCPTCGRCKIDLIEIVKKVEKALISCSLPIKVAIMGCIVNGPGEAKDADIGIAGGEGIGILFKKGKVVKRLPQEDLVKIIVDEINNFSSIAIKGK